MPEKSNQLEWVVNRLSAHGLDAPKIADALGLPLDEIRGTLTVTRRTQTPEEKEVADEARSLAVEVIKRAKIVLKFGAPDHRVAIMRAVLPNAMRVLGVQAESEQAELRMQMDHLFNQIRSVPPVETVVTPTEIIDVEPQAAPEATEDQDQGPRDTAFGY